ncbi:hypothetical protein CWC22_005095 [Pseudoalteromonas rubra]|uniref:Uncharacterized protein n=1 Tax=Pseudoalteromonas rubra TaxID=43658 RepID=A0A5S3UTF5_9GAMM|nr:hypothetical protein [Pseudoalteromonas rubra]QPB82395.1 hypothetical protein CWC22_005095 [Pseudoalteromonas rubra]
MKNIIFGSLALSLSVAAWADTTPQSKGNDGSPYVIYGGDQINNSDGFASLSIHIADTDAIDRDGCTTTDLNSGAGGDYIYLCADGNNNPSSPKVTQLKIFQSDSSAEDTDIVTACGGTGWIALVEDLNQGSGGDWIYLCYKTGSSNKITSIRTSNHSGKNTAMNHCKLNGHKVVKNTSSEAADLNSGAGGDYIFVCTK